MDYATKDYKVLVKVGDREDSYEVLNMKTQVSEYTDHLLPRALQMMLELQELLDEYRAKIRKGNIKAIGGDDEGDSLH